MGEDDPQNQRALYDDMVRKAQEIETLVSDEKLVEEARQHLDKLAGIQVDDMA